MQEKVCPTKKVHQATSYIFSFLFWTISDQIYITNTNNNTEEFYTLWNFKGKTPKLCNNVNNVTSNVLQYHSSHDKNDRDIKEMEINSPSFNLARGKLHYLKPSLFLVLNVLF